MILYAHFHFYLFLLSPCLLRRATNDMSDDHTTYFTLDIFTEANDLKNNQSKRLSDER
jgi:hypothetical protein